MLDIEELKPKIIEKLKILNPDKIILFGSHAYGVPTEESDIDLFLIKDGLVDSKKYTLEAKKRLRDIIMNYKTNGIDILSASQEFINSREDYFYKIDILQNGKVWYEQKIS
jgi:predicted nucleotidyltransferase